VRLERWAVRAAIVVTILGFAPGLLNPFELFKASLLRVLGLALLAHGVVATFARRGVRDDAGQAREHRAPSAVIALDVAAMAYVISRTLSTLTSVSARLSVFGEIDQRDGLLTTLALAGVYVGARRSHQTAAHLRGTVDAMLGAVSLAAVYALAQWAGLDPLNWSGTLHYTSSAASLLRPFGTLGNPILLGALIAPALAIAISRACRSRRGALAFTLLSVSLAVTLAATLSRGPWIAAGVAGAVALGTTRTTSPTNGRRVAIASTLVALVVAIGIAFMLRLPLLVRLSEDSRSMGLSDAARVNIARAAISIWRAHPWLGSGPDTFGLLFPTVQTPRFWAQEWIGVPAHAHSVVFQALATGGAAAALVIAVGFVALITLARSASRLAGAQIDDVHDGLLALLSISVAGVFFPIGIAGATAFAALSAAAVTRVSARSGAEASSIGMTRLAVAAGLLVAVVVALSGAGELRAMMLAGRAHARYDRIAGDPTPLAPDQLDLMTREARAATNLRPTEDELWRLRCDTELAAARETTHGMRASRDHALVGVTAARAAIALEPRRASNVQRLADALARRAQLEDEMRNPSASVASSSELARSLTFEADSVFRSAERLAPADGLLRLDHARCQLELREPEAALTTAREIVHLYPGSANGYTVESAAFLMLGQTDSLRIALRRSVGSRWDDPWSGERLRAIQLLNRLDDGDHSR
jgi:O-antigen ligase